MSVYKVYKKTKDGVELVKIPIDNIDLSDLPTVKAGLKNADEVGGTSVEDINNIDMWVDSVANLGYLGNEDGIAWDELAEVFSDKGDHTFEIAHRIPLSAGNDIEFVNDGSTISINSTVNQKLNTFKNDYNTHKHTITPSGSVLSTFTGKSMTSTGSFTPSGSVSKITHTPAGSVTISATASTSGNYTPAGSVSKPNVTVTPSTSSFLTGSSLKASLANDTLTLSVDASSGSAMTSATAELAATPTFTGTKVAISGSFSGTEFSVTPSFTGTEGTVNVSGTTTGSVSSSFTGTSSQYTSTPV